MRRKEPAEKKGIETGDREIIRGGGKRKYSGGLVSPERGKRGGTGVGGKQRERETVTKN
jgi:hypothetical protein